MQSLLNTTHMKYVSAFKLDAVLAPKHVPALKSAEASQNDFLERIEFEMNFQKEATSRWMNFEVMREFQGIDRLVSYSTVCDLLLIENVGTFEQYEEKQMQEMIDRVHCPVVILPERVEHDSIIIVNDSSLDIVNLTKSFLNIFKPELRKLPVSVFVETPEHEEHIHNEKAFIDYLKLYFKNIGTQLMDCDAGSCIEEYLHKESLKPIILMNSKSMRSFKQQYFFKSGPIENLVAFVIKSQEK